MLVTSVRLLIFDLTGRVKRLPPEMVSITREVGLEALHARALRSDTKHTLTCSILTMLPSMLQFV